MNTNFTDLANKQEVLVAHLKELIDTLRTLYGQRVYWRLRYVLDSAVPDADVHKIHLYGHVVGSPHDWQVWVVDHDEVALLLAKYGLLVA